MTISSDDSKGSYPRSDAYLALLECMRHAGAGKVNEGKYKGVTWDDAYRSAEKIDWQRGDERCSAAIFDRILELALAKARNERVLKSALGGGRVLFVKSMAEFTAMPARSKAMKDAQLRAFARRLARR